MTETNKPDHNLDRLFEKLLQIEQNQTDRLNEITKQLTVANTKLEKLESEKVEETNNQKKDEKADHTKTDNIITEVFQSYYCIEPTTFRDIRVKKKDKFHREFSPKEDAESKDLCE